MTTRIRTLIFSVFGLLVATSIYFTYQLQFSFDFEQFFPQKDPDLAFFQKFVKEFETDDNFMLVAVRRKEGAFEQKFLEKFADLTDKAHDLPFVQEAQSLTNIQLPVKTPFGFVPLPAIHVNDPERYEEDKEKLVKDERFAKSLISDDGTALVLFLKTREHLNLEESEQFIGSLDSLIKPYNFPHYHYLGRANFQKELVAMEKREVAVSSAISALLVGIVMFLIFRRWISVLIALLSIGFSMLLFLGILGAWGRDISALAALYPVLMVIVGTSDVIHMLSKYIDELHRGHTKEEAIRLTIKEVGLATLMTAVTTAIGFATLITGRIRPIQEFGVNAAIGVMVAYLTVLIVSTAFMSLFSAEQLIKKQKSGSGKVERLMAWTYEVTKYKSKQISLIFLGIFVLCLFGISKIKTNFSISDSMPIGSKVTEDFYTFEKIFAGFRPIEYAVFAQNGRKADSYEVMREMEKVERHIKEAVPSIRSVNSMTMVYKSIHKMNGNDYQLPEDSTTFNEYKELAKRMPATTANVLMSRDSSKARIATRILDLGADSVMAAGDRIDKWILKNTDPKIATFKRTGTGYIIDKNAMYVRDDLVEGIAWEVGLIALIMAFLLQEVRMIFIFLIPNLFPLVFAGALVGYLGVDLDAPISMIFTVIFGIAIDDTIHFLSSFRINQRKKGMTVDEALRVTLLETGKPVCLTTIILFFGFLVMIFSINPPSITVGKLIAVTLVTALASDLFINPILIRWWIKDKK